ncbi:UNVERIFIED_CONTAM: hypothetical protein Scaly_2982200 [Sesamum calycinum]|uniref:CCHC-type domain-containing protein n=1 Tax=Sesamum calycinum TaxID=2727403 RepID=A0AAW2KNB7_9LAMI
MEMEEIKRLRYDSVDGSGLTSSNVIRLESSVSRKNGEAEYLGILLDKNGIEYFPQGYFHVNRKSGTWKISLVDPKPTRKSLPPSYDPFNANFNMNGLEKSINELVNMLQNTLRALPLLQWEWAKGKRRMGTQQQSRGNDICVRCHEKGHWKRNCPNLSSNQDVCRPLNTQARGGFSYFITFTDDHSWYGYVYLMRYKSKAFVRFEKFRLEVEKKLVAKIKPFDQTEVESI